MSDQPTPPKPKPGSLRDRIAAFEKPASGAAPGPAPVPRPKPGGISWKPKQPSPPSSPSTADVSLEKTTGGMSASDAKESIKTGGSLKERMAALQNRGGFGAPPPVAPKPPMEKPKWKPPPVIAPVDKDDDDEPSRDDGPTRPGPPLRKSTSEDKAAGRKDEGEPGPAVEEAETEAGEAAEADPEEEERQRRAAIAARMARLGGARVGMAPVFGRAPSTKKSIPEPAKPETPAEVNADESKSQEEAAPLQSQDEPVTTGPALDETVTVTSDTVEQPSVPVRKDSESSPSLPSEAEGQTTRGTPNSMPLPSALRRAAPPRRKAPKSPEVLPPAVVDERIVSSPENVPAPEEPGILDSATTVGEGTNKERIGDIEEEVGEVNKSVEVQEPSVTADTLEDKPPVVSIDFEKEDVPEEPSEGAGNADVADVEPDDETTAYDAAVPAHPTELITETADDEADEEAREDAIPPKAVPVEDVSVTEVEEVHEHASEVAEQEPEPVEEEPIVQNATELDDEDEDEEAARRQRIAEKLAKMGGINPFAPPPQRKVSGSSEDVQTSPLIKRASISRNSVGSPPLPPAPPRRQSTRETISETSATKSPASPSVTSEDVTEPTKLEDTSIESEDDSREINEEKTVADITPTTEIDSDTDTTNAYEESKIYHEPVTAPALDVTEGLAYESSEDISDVEPEIAAPSPPVPNLVTRPGSIRIPAPVNPALPTDPVTRVSGTTPAVASAISPRRSVPPPPPRLVPEPIESEDLSESVLSYASSPQASQSPVSYNPSEEEEDEEPLRHVPLRRSTSTPEPADDDKPLPVLNRRSMQSDDFIPSHSAKRLSARPSRFVPLPPTISAPVSDVEDSDFDEVLPTPPRHRPGTPGTPVAQSNEIPLIVPPPTSDEAVKSSPLRHSSYPDGPEKKAATPTMTSGEVSRPLVSPPIHRSTREILDEEEGDPIDPSFHSPSQKTPPITQPVLSPPDQEPVDNPVEDGQAARRRTIAERMAKLGGIKFGAAPLPHTKRPTPPAPKEEEAEDTPEHGEPAAQSAEATEFTEEEEERARKERIAAKLAMMGGMRIGMMPLGVGTVRPQASHALTEGRPPAPPSRTASTAPPPPPPQAHDSDDHENALSGSQYSNPTSDEGVKVEAEDSEIEEVSHADAQETEEEPEEVPPPVPARGPRKRETAGSESELSTSPPSRPPVPATLPTRRASVQSTSSTPRRSSADSTQGVQRASTYKPHSEYVMVEEPSGFVPDEGIPPPPPARPSHRAPPSRPPPPPQPSIPISDSISSQWEMPSIPSSSIEFSTPADISLTWPEDSSPPAPVPPVPSPPKPSAAVDIPLSSDDLMIVWGRVGVQICEVATTLYDKSKKSLVGDGTYDGFIRTVLNEVPNAAMPTSNASYGYLVYAQTGSAVQKRASDIMPGDILVLQDAKLKGHKGLQSYHQNVGIGQPLVGVVSEFEPKKSKVRLFQANQHVGQQTVEAVSYRLEDLKSGTVKVFRVLENQ
ncbi:hypothetical protein DXG01_008027 [Tephrocybe rancida]|nr:hypothetical protein DXG01_008027 [Tephrocybe rancida]